MVAIQHSQDFLGGPVVKTLPSSAGSTGGFPGGTSGKDAVCQCRRHKRPSSFHESGRSLGGGHGNPLQYSCLENPMNRRDWWATVHEVTKELDTTGLDNYFYHLFKGQ